MGLIQRELEAQSNPDKFAEEAHRGRNRPFTETPPPLPQVPPPDDLPAPPSQRLDMLVGKKIETPTKKVSFMNEAEEDVDRKFDSNANNINDEKLSRLQRVEKDPNVSKTGLFRKSLDFKTFHPIFSLYSRLSSRKPNLY
jgi:hypothetical protein